MFGSFGLFSERAYFQSQASRTTTHGVFYGILLLALMVNGLNWVTARKGINGLFVGFVGFSLLAILAVNGYLHAFVLGSWSAHHSTIQLWAFAGMAVTAIGFAARMLQLRAWWVWLERSADALGGSDVTGFVSEPLDGLATLCLGICFGCLLDLWHGLFNRKCAPVGLAFLVFAPSQWVSMGTVLGLLLATPVNLGMWQIGLVIHFVLLQLALEVNSQKSRWLGRQQQVTIDSLKRQADAEARRSGDLQRFFERLKHEFKTPLTAQCKAYVC